MKENKQLLICSIILSISIIIGCVWIGNSIRKINKDNNVIRASSSLTSSKAFMTEKETAEYLNISLEKFENLLTNEELQKRNIGIYDTYSFIPFVKIDGVKYFNKEQVDKWVEYNITRWMEINTNLK